MSECFVKFASRNMNSSDLLKSIFWHPKIERESGNYTLGWIFNARGGQHMFLPVSHR